MSARSRLLLAMLAGAFAHPAIAEDVIKETASGHINWTDGVVSAQGYGTYDPEITNTAQQRLLARRAAIVDGQRNLLEMTKGVRLTSMTRVEDMMVASEKTATRVEGIIKGAAPTKESYQNDIYVVTMTMPIAGDLMAEVYQPEIARFDPIPGPSRLEALVADSLIFLVDAFVPRAHAAEPLVFDGESEADTARKILNWIESSQPSDVTKALSDAITNYEATATFSGLLIDATGVPHFEMATVPNIRDGEGNVIYPNPETSYQDIVNKRGVTYDLDLADAVRNQRVATTPLVVNAVNTYKNLNSDLVISKEDASRIISSSGTKNAMNKTGVLIVVSI